MWLFYWEIGIFIIKRIRREHYKIENKYIEENN